MIWHWYRGGQSYPETYIYSQCVEPTKLHYTTLWWPQYIWQSCISLPLAFDLICFLLCSILQFAVRCKSHVNTTHHKLSTIASRFLSTCMTLIPMKRITQIAPLQVYNYIQVHGGEKKVEIIINVGWMYQTVGRNIRREVITRRSEISRFRRSSPEKCQ